MSSICPERLTYFEGWKMKRLLKLLPAHDGVGQDSAAGVLDGRAGGQAAGQPGDLHAGRPQQRADVKRGAVAGEVGVCRHDDFFNLALTHPLDQLVDRQVARLDAFQRRDMAAEDVIGPLACARFLKAYDVLGLLDDADEALIAPGVRTDLADGLLREVVADLAAFDLVLDVPDGLGQRHGLSGLGLQDMKSQPLGRLGPHPGELPKFLDQLIQTLRICAAHKFILPYQC